MTNELSYNVKWNTNNSRRLQESIRLQLCNNLINSQRITSNIEHLESIKFPFFLHNPCKREQISLLKPKNIPIKQKYKSNTSQHPIHRCSTTLRQYHRAINDIVVKKSERKYSVGCKISNTNQTLNEIMLKNKLYRTLRMSFDKTVELNSKINTIDISYEHYNQYLRNLQSTLGIPMKLIFLLKSEFISLDSSNQYKNYKDIYCILIKGIPVYYVVNNKILFPNKTEESAVQFIENCGIIVNDKSLITFMQYIQIKKKLVQT